MKRFLRLLAVAVTTSVVALIGLAAPATASGQYSWLMCSQQHPTTGYLTSVQITSGNFVSVVGHVKPCVRPTGAVAFALVGYEDGRAPSPGTAYEYWYWGSPTGEGTFHFGYTITPATTRLCLVINPSTWLDCIVIDRNASIMTGHSMPGTYPLTVPIISVNMTRPGSGPDPTCPGCWV